MSSKQARYEDALNRGHSYSWDQKWTEAIKEFESAVAEIPTEPAPYAGLGMAYYELQELDKALSNYKLAARYSQGDIIYLRQIANVQEELGLSREAGKTYMAIGEIQIRRRLLDEAVENWHRAVRLDPDLLGGHQRLAAVYQRQGLAQSAIKEMLASARILQARGDQQKALQICQQALQLDPRNPDVLTAIELVQHNEMLPSEWDHDDHLSELLSANGDTPTTPTGDPAVDGLDDPLDWDQPADEELSNPVEDARRMALERLAEELFDDEGDEDDFAKLQRDALISKALDFQTRGLLNEAISCYEQCNALGVNSSAVAFNLGLLYQERLRFEDAIKEFESVKHDPEYRLGSHFALGECHRARGRIEQAVEHFVTVLKIVDLQTVEKEHSDRLIQLYENLADSLVTKGEPEKATAFANTLVDFLSHKGWEDKVMEARGRLDAISVGNTMILGDILTAGSEHVLESLYLSQEYARRGMLSAAVEEAYRAVQLSADYLPAHMQLGHLLALQKRSNAAAQKFIVVGDTFRVRGDINSAITAYEEVVNISPLDITVRSRLIDLLKRHGQIDRALEHYLALGDSYYQLAQLDKARDAYQEALKLAPRGSVEVNWQARLLRLIGDIDMQRLDWARALTSFRELRKLEPADERAAITLIDLYYKTRQPRHALSELDQYLIQLIQSGRGGKVTGILEDMNRQRPNDAGLVERLARLYGQQNRVQDAVELLDKLGDEQISSGEIAKAIKTVTKIVHLSPPQVGQYKQLLADLQQQADA